MLMFRIHPLSQDLMAFTQITILMNASRDEVIEKFRSMHINGMFFFCFKAISLLKALRIL